MSKLLVLYGYNNYFNRIIKKENSIESYKSAVGTGYYVELNDTNFNVTDGVNARHVFNISSFLDEKSPDYMVRQKKDGTLERWFVLESVKIMGNQIQLTLRRDILADHYEDIITSPAFIQKGIVNYDSPLIFNKEGLTYNQIKQKEILLKDETKCAWIVGYLARNSTLDTEQEIKGYSEAVPGIYDNYNDLPAALKSYIEGSTEITNIRNSNIYFDFFTQWVEKSSGQAERVFTRFGFWTRITVQNRARRSINIISEEQEWAMSRGYINFYREHRDSKEASAIIDPTQRSFRNIRASELTDKIISAYSLNDFNFESYIDKTIVREGEYYRIKVREVGDLAIDRDLYKSDMNNGVLGIFAQDFINVLTSQNDLGSSPVNQNNNKSIIGIHCNTKKYVIYLEKDYQIESKTKISNFHQSGTTVVQRNRLDDAPYDMFAIPYGDNIVISEGVTSFNSVKSVALPIARGFIEKLTNSIVYDIQILPYCPCPEFLNGEELDLTNLTEKKDYEFIRNSTTNDKLSVVLFPRYSKRTFDIAIDLESNPELNIAFDNIERKVEAETRIVRLVSPNFNGIYEFNAQKNDGVSVINVDMNFKPFTPYIHVAPIFGGLYGQDFNDPKGLICGGDYSISAAYSQWEQYQIQNKNYENIFNRQIQNLDINNQIAMDQTKLLGKLNTVTAAVSGATGGAIAGAQTRNPFVAAAGGVVGGAISGITSGIGAQKDIEFLLRQQSENRDYAVDMYTYQLGNIQALPYTLSKVSAFNENNKIFPFIEIYSCTDVEKQNLRDKIKYNGMTVMVQGMIKDFIDGNGSYIQAQLIRMQGVLEDNHSIVEIYNELMKGAYLYERDTESD